MCDRLIGMCYLNARHRLFHSCTCACLCVSRHTACCIICLPHCCIIVASLLHLLPASDQCLVHTAHHQQDRHAACETYVYSREVSHTHMRESLCTCTLAQVQCAKVSTCAKVSRLYNLPRKHTLNPKPKYAPNINSDYVGSTSVSITCLVNHNSRQSQLSSSVSRIAYPQMGIATTMTMNE